jgi:hypothetical protein
MRKAFFGFVAALLVCISAYAENFDAAADDQILTCVHSRKFSQVKIDYPFGDYVYPIWIIHNPQRERLWVEEISSPQTWPKLWQIFPPELMGVEGVDSRAEYAQSRFLH